MSRQLAPAEIKEMLDDREKWERLEANLREQGAWNQQDEIDKADEGNELRMSIDTSNLLGFSYVFPNDGVDMRNTVKEVDEDTDEVTVEDLNCQQTKERHDE